MHRTDFAILSDLIARRGGQTVKWAVPASAVVGCFPVLTEAEIFAREGHLTTHLLKLLRSLPHE